MDTAKKLAGVVFLLVFVSAIALRPLMSNPAISAALEDGLFNRGTLLALPLLLVTVLLVAFRLRSLRDDGKPDNQHTEQVTPNTWDTGTRADGDRADHVRADHDRDERWGVQPEEAANDESSDQRNTDDTSGTHANFLSGQGGARDRDFEIEEKPPDATLRDHLDHLQTELGDDTETASDLETLEEVVEEVEGDRTVPPRCPQSQCDAVWSERTIFHDDRGRYQLLDDGRKAQCLECESVVTLEK